MDDKALRPAQLGDGDHDLADQGAACFSITIDDDHVARPNKIQGLVNKQIVAGRHAYGQGGTRHYGGRAVERPEADRPRESVEIVANDRRRTLPESGKDIFKLCRCVIVTHGMYSDRKSTRPNS